MLLLKVLGELLLTSSALTFHSSSYVRIARRSLGQTGAEGLKPMGRCFLQEVRGDCDRPTQKPKSLGETSPWKPHLAHRALAE